MDANFECVVLILFFKNVLIFVDWFKNVSANFVYVYKIGLPYLVRAWGVLAGALSVAEGVGGGV